MYGRVAARPWDHGSPHRLLTLSWENHDRHHAITFFAVLGVAGAVIMALVGLPPVDVHGPFHYVGIMDPLCGMTRAARLLAQGQLNQAITYNPASPILALLAIGAVIRAAIGTGTGHWLAVTISRSRTLYVAAGLGVAALWINQQVHAGLLMQTH